jgi:hypothetical protein
VLQQPDNYIEGTLENFLGPEGLKRLGGITDTDKEELDSNFNLSEVGEAIKKKNQLHVLVQMAYQVDFLNIFSI